MQEQPKVELIDIYDITYNPWWLSSWFKLCASGLFGVLIIALSYVLYKKYKKKISLPYWQQTLRSIELLKKQGFEDGQLFYVRLTQVVKQYLHERYKIALADKTDSEMLETLKHTPDIPPLVYKEVKEIFDGVMFIKFANQHAAKERMEQALIKSQELVSLTHEQQEEVKK